MNSYVVKVCFNKYVLKIQIYSNCEIFLYVNSMAEGTFDTDDEGV